MKKINSQAMVQKIRFVFANLYTKKNNLLFLVILLFFASTASFFWPMFTHITSYSDGGDRTGIWQLTINKLPSHGMVSISFLTDNEGDSTNYIALANTEFKTNGAAISTTMRGDGKGGARAC